MKLKKTISLLFSVVIVAGAMCGCNSEGSTQPKGMISIDDPAVLQPNSKIITAELLEKAATNPVVTSEDHPRWTGFNLGYFDDLGDAGTTAKTVELSAEWGFNSARVCFKYDELFSRDMTQADMDAFRILDSMVAAAIENDMHLNLALYSLPGRNVIEAAAENDYISTAELDLFINEEQQVLANKVLSTIAHRYKDVPNFNLSISPLYEPTNTNLSTGLPSPDYTWDDVAVYLGKAIDA
ncbi:MAG: cellulase family glycosylhydrolase, partial [Oscillospiraceae bacterium]|nr:cellulase family glycosylhydrolase [Oscillospiraceae bacterium]